VKDKKEVRRRRTGANHSIPLLISCFVVVVASVVN
jgi:hypothetical protein